MRKLSIGIDIGSDGGIAFITDDDMGYNKIPKVGNELNIGELSDLITDWLNSKTIVKCVCVIEDLHSVFGSSAKSNFAFGKNNGLIIGMLQTLRIPFIKVSPKAWQKQMWQGIRPVEINTGKKKKDGTPKYKIDTKKTSLIAAQRLFPKEKFLATNRSSVSHDGIVDSILLAEFGRRNYF